MHFYSAVDKREHRPLVVGGVNRMDPLQNQCYNKSPSKYFLILMSRLKRTRGTSPPTPIVSFHLSYKATKRIH